MAEQMSQMEPGEGHAAWNVSMLMQMEETAKQAYDAAIGKLRTSHAAPSLRRFRENHQEHEKALKTALGDLGEQQPQGTQALGEFRQQVVDAVSVVHTDDGVFAALRIAEAEVQLQYDIALGSSMPEQTRRLLEKCSRDEREHVSFLEMVRQGIPH